MKKRIWTAMLAITMAFSSVSCQAQEPEGSSASTPVIDAAQGNLGVWAVYWDNEEVLGDIRTLQNRLESLHYFAAYFDEQDRLFVPEGTKTLRQKINSTYGIAPPWKSYLTIVNDQEQSNGMSSLKDTDLLYRLLATKEAQTAHINEILALAKDGGYQGIEIDYETIRKDYTLWEHFIQFIEALYQKTEQQGLTLRVILEPGVEYEKLTFPTGPEYAIMCYNLYGTGTKPGPKANDEFLRSLVKKTETLPGKRYFAVATGGFDWQDDHAVALTEQQAETIALTVGAKTTRDADSQALSFTYLKDGKTREVWYADAVTLNHWMSVLQSTGDVGVAVWRLGGTPTDNWLQ